MSKKKLYLRFVSVAFQMMFLIAGGALLGKYLDGESGESKLYTILFSLFGVFASMYLVIREALAMTKK